MIASQSACVRKVRGGLRRVILLCPVTRRWYKRGYFSKAIRRQRFVNWFFKVIFRVNADCPWSVHYTSRVIVAERITIGACVERSFLLSGGCYIQGGNGIEIGDRPIFGPGVKIISANHGKSDLRNWTKDRPIRIGRDCWIGANAVILPGVHLGDRVIVGAGAVVTRDVPPGATVVGNPARPVSEAMLAKSGAD